MQRAKHRRYLSIAFYEGETAEQSAPPAPSNQTPPPGANPPPSPGTPGTPPPPVKKTFTQEEVNNMTAEERKKWLQKNRELVDSLDQIRQQSNLTQQQRDELQGQIEQLQATYRTEKETKELEQAAAKKKYETDTNALKKERDTWKTRFEENTISVDISNAAVKWEAYSVPQIQAILRPMARVVEIMDENNKATGRYQSKITFPGRDKDGKEVMLDLSVDDAVKAMTEMPEQYGNLFKNKSMAGIGGNGMPQIGNGRLGNIADMDLETYKKNREKIQTELRQRT